jgi:hypothetical protein
MLQMRLDVPCASRYAVRVFLDRGQVPELEHTSNSPNSRAP